MKFNTLCYIPDVRLGVPADLKHEFSKQIPKKAPLKPPEVFHSVPTKLLKNKPCFQKVTKVAKNGDSTPDSSFLQHSRPAQPGSVGDTQ